jgi:hypothetical protein
MEESDFPFGFRSGPELVERLPLEHSVIVSSFEIRASDFLLSVGRRLPLPNSNDRQSMRLPYNHSITITKSVLFPPDVTL